jgi:uncharacterized damage-inducible protein DinB
LKCLWYDKRGFSKIKDLLKHLLKVNKIIVALITKKRL